MSFAAELDGSFIGIKDHKFARSCNATSQEHLSLNGSMRGKLAITESRTGRA